MVSLLNNISMDGIILKEKAENFDKSLRHNTITASNGWVDKLKSATEYF